MKPVRVVVTGSECTGKTTLAERLARWFGAPWSAEYARAHQEAKPVPLDAGDVEPIARGQIAFEDQARSEARTGLVMHDTDLVSTWVYAHHYYGDCPEWIERAARDRRADLYLLCHPDVPWVADGLTRDAAGIRDEMHGRFARALEAIGARVVDVTGPWAEREARAIRAVEGRLAEVGDVTALRKL